MQNSLPSGSASTTQPRPSGSRRSSTSVAPRPSSRSSSASRLAVGGTQVQVQPVLDLLGVRHLDEQQPGRAVGREDHALLVTGLVGVVGILGVAEHLRPPDRLRVRVVGVDGEVTEIADHRAQDRTGPWISSVMVTCTSSTSGTSSQHHRPGVGGGLHPQGAAAEHPIGQAPLVRDVVDPGQRQVGAGLVEDAGPGDQPVVRQRVRRGPPAQERDDAPPGRQHPGHDRHRELTHRTEVVRDQRRPGTEERPRRRPDPAAGQNRTLPWVRMCISTRSSAPSSLADNPTAPC